MSTAKQLLAAIIAHPDEDTPRLMYADWCDENDQPERAELIRVQVELAQVKPWTRRAFDLRHRERVLLAVHGPQWYAELGELDGAKWGEFRRGFVYAVHADSIEKYLDASKKFRTLAPIEAMRIDTPNTHIPDVLPATDWIREVKLTSEYEFEAEDLQDLLNSPLALEVRRLRLANEGIENAGALVIAQAKHLKKLEDLDFTNCFIGNEGAAALAEAAHLRSVQHLRFSSHGSGYVEDPFVTVDGVRALTAKESVFQNLETLELSGNPATPESIREIFSSPTLRNLKSLHLGYAEQPNDAFNVPDNGMRLECLNLAGMPLPEPALRQVTSLPQVSEIQQLRLGYSRLGAPAVEALASASFTSRVSELDLRSMTFDANAIAALAKGNWENLHYLNLQSCQLNAASAKILATCHFPALTTLRLDDNNLGDAGIAAVVNAPWAANLRVLSIGQWGGGRDKPTYTEEGFRVLCQSPNLSNLTCLSLTGQFTGDLAAVMGNLNWPNLRDLHFNGLHLRDEGALKIITSEFARNLIILSLENCRLSETTLNAIQEHGTDWQLGQLRLSNNRFEKYGLATLAEKGTLPKLRSLNVSYCDMMIPTLMRFAQTAFAKRLRHVVLYGNATSAQLQTLIAGREYATLGADWLELDHLREHYW